MNDTLFPVLKILRPYPRHYHRHQLISLQTTNFMIHRVTGLSSDKKGEEYSKAVIFRLKYVHKLLYFVFWTLLFVACMHR